MEIIVILGIFGIYILLGWLLSKIAMLILNLILLILDILVAIGYWAELKRKSKR